MNRTMQQLQWRGLKTPSPQNIEYLEVRLEQLDDIIRRKKAQDKFPDLVYLVLEKVSLLHDCAHACSA